ncbi:phage tail protein [Sphingobacterium deserti]|uniref:Tail spike domain-containing protein n=1 Tax=Sphingobacterium deserti TaxID=1229276 RepID=A0A0B8T7T6_9SPHI|nr:phage tail protein [Sphingobacterium deserti]KGE14614.1 hypothetical protein DI53_1643 [Sphingobacterium deserti]
MEIQVYRKQVETVKLPLNVSTFSDALMGAHELVFDFTVPVLLDIQVGDYITYKGERMNVNLVPTYGHDGMNIYCIIFQGVRHDLERWLLKDEGSPYVEYFGTLDDYMFMFLESVNASDSGWTLGNLDKTEPKALVFDNVYLWDALTMIAELFEMEWIIRSKQISVKKTVGAVRALSFSYGKGNGLYSLSRENIDGGRIITRAFAIGGSQNLPAGYGPKRLTMPGHIEDAAAIAAYGLREGSYSNEDIYPHRTGTVSGIDQINEGTWVVADSELDFDLNGQRIAGTDAQIVFTSGALNGQTFKILSYNHTSKEIRYEANKDSNGKLSPADLFRAEIGDKYTIVGIRMPQSYVDAALAELKGKAQEYLDSNKVPRVRYSLEIDLYRAKVQNYTLNAGDIINVKHDSIGLDADIRVTTVSYPGHFPDVLENGMRFTSEIANEVTYNRMQKVEKDIKETRNVVTRVSRTSWENDRRNVVALNEFIGKVLDPDGNLQEPLLKAIVGFFGTQSMFYDLDGVTYETNVGGNPNAFSISGGRLIHKVYKISPDMYIWNLSALSVSALDPLKPYYLAAKCSRTALTGEWVLSETQFATEAEAGYWYFNLGILSSVIEGSRSLESTKGYTMISGGQIVTDTISAYQINVERLFAQLISVGSQGFEKAGISGLADREHLSQRFWAGATAANRYDAPFQVLEDGSMKAFKGEVGGFKIDSNSLRVGTNDTWDVNGRSVFLTPEYFMLRENGTIRGQRREFSWNLYKEQFGARQSAATSIFNTVATADPQFPYTNVALELDAKNGNHNYALYVQSGMSRFKAIAKAFQTITGTGQAINEEFSMVFINPGVVPGNIPLPSYPELGYQVTIKNLSNNDFFLVSNNGSIIQENGSATSSNSFRRYAIKTFFFKGDYWIEMFQQSNN